jgi:hypothetical protein
MSDLSTNRARKVAQNNAKRAADEVGNIDQVEGARAESVAKCSCVGRRQGRAR